MRADDKREDILVAATHVFPRLGYHKATVEDVLREAGVARSTFYVYFPNKHEVFVASVKRIMEAILEDMDRSVDAIMERFGDSVPDDEAVEDALVSLMVDVFNIMGENKGMTRVFLHELAGIDDEMTALLKSFLDSLVDQFERLVDFGVRIGMVREVNRRRAADFIVGGLFHLARNFSAGIADYDIEEVSREFVEMQLIGLRSDVHVRASVKG